MSKKDKKNIDPYQVIDDFFSSASLDQHRKYISSVLKVAYSEDYWRKSDPGRLLFFQERVANLIRATHLFVSEGRNRIIRKKIAVLKEESVKKMIDPATYFGWHKQDAMWEFFPRCLSKKEFVNPYLAFEKFFDYKSLDEWLKDFKELVSYALSPYGNESALEFDYLKINRLLQKLIEASHLIQVRVTKHAHLDTLEDNHEISDH